ncbi:MAG: Tetratricopeptide 2 repeat protein [Pedosphaera sp.]|nr:Tetratricopeptide 2 repeat protein [Pedosphaera sp.]
MDSPEQKRQVRLIFLVLGLGTLFLYSPATAFGFLGYNDPDYIANNSHVRDGLSLSDMLWAFTTFRDGSWQPVTWLSHMLDCQLFGLSPRLHHLTSLLLHVANTLLLFGLLKRMTGAVWRSAFVAALFAWHPLHVETVAWIADRKDVLSTFFWLLTMGAYLRYVEKPGQNRYLLMLACFALGLMTEPMLVTLPFVLLLLDCWPLQRLTGASSPATPQVPQLPLSRLAMEKAPMFAPAVISSAVTILALPRGHTLAWIQSVPLNLRITNALAAYSSYLRKMFWPADLAVVYPLPASWPLWQWLGGGLILLAVSLAVLALRRQRPYLAVGWFWFVGTLVPVIGLVQFEPQAMADRFSYLPLIGVFIMLAWGVNELTAAWTNRRPILATTGALALLSCMALTVYQLRPWKNTVALFNHALDVTTNNAVAHGNLALALDAAGKPDEAMTHYQAALRLLPDSPFALYLMGLKLAHQGNYPGAIEHYNAALRQQPDAPSVHYNLANIFTSQGKLDEAAAHYTEAIRLEPDAEDAHNNLGIVLVKLNRLDAAADHFKTALSLNPANSEIHYELGSVLLKQGQTLAAQSQFSEAVHLKPDFAKALLNLGLIQARDGDIDKAITNFLACVTSDPKSSEGYFNLGSAYYAQNKLQTAADAFFQAIQLKPDDTDAYFRLGIILTQQGKYEGAIACYKELLRRKPSEAQAHARLAALLAVQGNAEAAIKSYGEALRLKPDWPEALRDLAWIYGTNQKAEIRNGAEALRLAARASELTKDSDPRFLSALDAAYAEVGRFDDAIKTAQRAQQLAVSANQKSLADMAAHRLELYRAGKPYRE